MITIIGTSLKSAIVGALLSQDCAGSVAELYLTHDSTARIGYDNGPKFGC